MIVEDCALSRVASELNARGYKHVQAGPGPRAISSACFRAWSRLALACSSEQWTSRRQRLPRVV